MNLTYAHAIIVVAVLVSATTLGLSHLITGESITNVYIACLGSISGHAVGFAAAKNYTGEPPSSNHGD